MWFNWILIIILDLDSNIDFELEYKNDRQAALYSIDGELPDFLFDGDHIEVSSKTFINRYEKQKNAISSYDEDIFPSFNDGDLEAGRKLQQFLMNYFNENRN